MARREANLIMRRPRSVSCMRSVVSSLGGGVGDAVVESSGPGPARAGPRVGCLVSGRSGPEGHGGSV